MATTCTSRITGTESRTDSARDSSPKLACDACEMSGLDIGDPISHAADSTLSGGRPYPLTLHLSATRSFWGWRSERLAAAALPLIARGGLDGFEKTR